MEEHSFWHTLWSKLLNKRDSFGGRNTARRVYRLAILVGLTFCLLSCFTPVQAKAVQAESLCGNGSAPDYGLSYDLLQPHWTGNFRSEQEVLNELLKNYRDENGQPLDPTPLNLDDLQNKGALPVGLGQGFTLYVNAIVQAPPPVPAPEVTLALGDTIDEGMNTIQLAGTDWNDAVKAYNTRRAQIPGEVVARVSEYFGFELPVAFPYYQGANPGAPVQNPLATPPTPTP
jgi:hypothetical protein